MLSKDNNNCTRIFIAVLSFGKEAEMKRFIAAFAVLVLFLTLSATAGAESDKSRLNRERLDIGRGMLDMNAQSWQSMLPYLTHDIEYHDPVVDIQGIDLMTEFLYRLIFVGSPDLVTTIEEEICIDDRYMASWTMVGSFNGAPYQARGMTILPDSIGMLEYTSQYRCTALVYEFDQPNPGQLVDYRTQARVPAYNHLEKTKLLIALED